MEIRFQVFDNKTDRLVAESSFDIADKQSFCDLFDLTTLPEHVYGCYEVKNMYQVKFVVQNLPNVVFDFSEFCYFVEAY